MKGFAPAWRKSLALAAAYLLAVQMVVAGFALGVQAAPAADGLHAILCTASGDSDEGPAGSLPSRFDCCTLGCAMLGGLGHPAPHAVEVASQGFVLVGNAPAPSTACPGPGAQCRQRTARGPPRGA